MNMHPAHKKIAGTAVFLAALAAIATLAGCGDDAASSGTVSFAITDAPADDVTRVQLTVSAFELKPENGAPVMLSLPAPLVIGNLLELQGGNAVPALAPTDVPAGRYEWLRLYVVPGGSDSFVVDNAGGTHDLRVPGQRGNNPRARFVQLVSGFVVPLGGDADFTIDIDLRRALTKPAGLDAYLLRPALRVVDNSAYGAITGNLDAPLPADAACSGDAATGSGNAVYLYAGHAAETGDVLLDADGAPSAAGNPLAIAPLSVADSGGFAFRFDFLPPGDYTLALNCLAGNDNPDTDDAVLITATTNATLLAGETAVVALPP